MDVVTGPKKILVVEDSEVQAVMLGRLLGKKGYEVLSARNGQEALAKAKTDRPDLVVSDVIMPVMDGYSMCREIKLDPALRGIPVLLLTELSELQGVIMGLESFADGYLTKPYNDQVLAAKIEYMLQYPGRFPAEPRGDNIEVDFAGRQYHISSSRRQILNFLLFTYENAVRQYRELEKAQAELRNMNALLEEKVRERTEAMLAEAAERIQAEKAMRESERKFHVMSEMQVNAVITIDSGGAVTYWNPAAERMFGISPASATGKDALRLFLPAKYQPDVKAKFDRLMEAANGVPSGDVSEVEAAGAGGKTFPAEIALSTFEFGGKWYAVAMVRDISERKRAERNLAESEEKYRTLVETSHDMIWKCDREGLFTYLNTAWERILGYRTEDMLGKKLTDLVPSEQAQSVETAFRRLLEGVENELVNFEILHKSKSGALLHINCNARPLHDPAGNITGAAGTAADITERILWEESLTETNNRLLQAMEELKKTQTMLVRSEKLASLGHLAAGVAHEIKNPLNIISTSVQFLQMGEAVPAETKEMYTTMTAQVGRMTKIIDNLRDFAREHKPEKKEVDVVNLLKKTASLVEYEMRVGNIELALDHRSGPIYILADSDQLAQVFLNMINNGRDSLMEVIGRSSFDSRRNEGWRARLIVETEEEGDWAVIRFRDNGTGIPQEAINRVFDPFFTTKPEGKGTGLGLSISMGIIEGHGGTLEAANANEHGAVFTIKLPLSARGNGERDE